MAISLKIKDMLGVSHADLQFNRGVNLIAGGNNSGKTSKSITYSGATKDVKRYTKHITLYDPPILQKTSSFLGWRLKVASL